MNYFENVLPMIPKKQEISDMVARVEARATAQMKLDACGDLIAEGTIDPYFMVSPEDSFEWMYLFTQAQKRDEGFAEIIWYIRGCGTRLVKNDKWGYVLKPDIQAGGWESWEHWNRDKHELLDPYGKMLIDLLQDLGVMNECK